MNLHTVHQNPECYSYNNETIELEPKIRTDKLKFEIVEEGIIYPLSPSKTGSYDKEAEGGVLDKDFKFIENSSQIRYPQILTCDENNYYSWNTAPKNLSITNIPYYDETVVYVGIIHGAFGHVLIESISRLWYLLDKPALKIAIIKTKDAKLSIWFQFLELFGIPQDRCIIVEHPMQFKKVIVPEQSFCLHGWLHPDYLKIIERISSSVRPKKIKKLYLSRKFIANNRAIGEENIENLFKENGFYPFQPEQLSLKEQISFIKGAEEFVTTEGTSSHMALFLNPKAHFICLKRQDLTNRTQVLIDKIKNYKSEYININFNFLPSNSGQSPCILGFSNQLKEFCDKHNYHYNETIMFSSFANNVLKYIYTSYEFSKTLSETSMYCPIFQKLAQFPYGTYFTFKRYNFSKLLKLHFYYYMHKFYPKLFKNKYIKYFQSKTLPEHFLYFN